MIVDQKRLLMTDDFYEKLPVHATKMSKLLLQDHLFMPVPVDWHVIITDITNSTKAIHHGLHETVNLIATGSIVTVLNLAYKHQLTIPFFFGGDGATFIVPPSLKDIAIQALMKYQDHTLDKFNLRLRAGTVSVQEIYSEGKTLDISKFQSTDIFYIPVVLGDGLSYAEKVIKGEHYLAEEPTDAEADLNLTGMQCRWDKIAPPRNHDEVVSLLVIAPDVQQQSVVFHQVMDIIEGIYGTPLQRQPISVHKLKLSTAFSRIELEMNMKLGKITMFRQLRTWLKTLLGYLYFKTGKGNGYLKRLVKMSDTLVIDGKINTVITGTGEQRLKLETALDELERLGNIIYGLHVSKESVMSCYVRDLEDGHIHFVDGSEGGYTKAAVILKQKLKAGRHFL